MYINIGRKQMQNAEYIFWQWHLYLSLYLVIVCIIHKKFISLGNHLKGNCEKKYSMENAFLRWTLRTFSSDLWPHATSANTIFHQKKVVLSLKVMSKMLVFFFCSTWWYVQQLMVVCFMMNIFYLLNKKNNNNSSHGISWWQGRNGATFPLAP